MLLPRPAGAGRGLAGDGCLRRDVQPHPGLGAGGRLPGPLPR